MRGVFAIVAVVLTAACTAAAQPSKPAEPRSPAAPSKVSADDVEQVLRWSRGDGARAGTTAPPSRLLLAKRDGEMTPVTSDCSSASSFLPAPLPDRRVFLAKDGKLVILPGRGGQIQGASGWDDSLELESLLSIEHEATPLNILLVARPRAGGPSGLWVATVDSTSQLLSLKILDQTTNIQSDASYFARYWVPQCQAGGTDCVVVTRTHGGSFIDVEAKRGATRNLFRRLDGNQVVDASWNPEDSTSVLLLVACGT